MQENKVIIYTTNDGKTKIDVRLEEETLWLTQAQMCELYQMHIPPHTRSHSEASSSLFRSIKCPNLMSVRP